MFISTKHCVLNVELISPQKILLDIAIYRNIDMKPVSINTLLWNNYKHIKTCREKHVPTHKVFFLPANTFLK